MSLDTQWSAEHALDALLEALDEVVVVCDAEHRCRAVGARAAPLFGVEVGPLRGLHRMELLQRLSEASDDAAAFMSAVEAAAESAQIVELSRPERRQLLWKTLSTRSAGELVGVLDVVRDVTTERAAAAQVEEMAKALAEVTTIDPVTGLLNQRRFLRDLDREHRRAQRVWEPYAVARLDVNGMSSLNERLGWRTGDALLRRIGEELRAGRREYDLVGRYRADEFILCLPGADAAAAKVVLERALSRLYERVKEAFGQAISMSVGVAVWRPPSQDGPEDVVERTAAAMEMARRKGNVEMVVDTRESRWKEGIPEE